MYLSFSTLIPNMQLVSLLCLASVAVAHFQLNYPPTRGFDDDTEPQTICGGFNTVSNRTAFPLSGGQIQITSFHVQASVFAEISFDSNPTSFTQFNTSSNGTNYSPLIPVNQIPEGAACWNVNVASLNVTDAKDGTNATLVVIFDGGDGTLYQCADLILSSSASIPSGSIASNITCKDTSNAISTGTSAASSPTQSGGAMHSATVLTGWMAMILLGSLAVSAGLL